MKQEMNIYKIAEEAGVSPATVSRVITNSAKVSESKRSKVEEIIRKYGYRPNVLAQGLSNETMKIIGLVAADIENPYFSKLLTECSRQIVRRGFAPMVLTTMSQYALEVKFIQMVSDMRLDAVILMGGKSDELITDADYSDLVNRVSQTTPVVTTGKVDGTKCCRIGIDEMQSVDLAMEHLFSLGHRHIAFVGGFDYINSAYKKRTRYRNFLKSHGVTFRDRYVMDADYDINGGYTAMNKLLEDNRDRTMPTAVIAINDFVAVGVIHALKENGLQVPDDMSVLSFDNTYISELILPRMTSVDYDYEKLGAMLADAAIDLTERKDVPAYQMIAPQLFVRQSTGTCSERAANEKE